MTNFLEKYRPSNLSEMIGQKKQIETLKESLSKNPSTPIFIYGESGIGKTLAVKLLAKELNLSIYHTDASDIRGKEAITSLAQVAYSASNIFGQKRLILLDEIDALEDKRGREDAGGFAEITKIIDKTKQPIIFIANDPYENKKLRPIFNKCVQIRFDLPNKLSILKFAKEICDKEEKDYDLMSLKTLVENTKNDIRALLLDLETLCNFDKITLEDIEALGDRKRDEDVFKVLGKIFYPRGFLETKNAINDLSIDWELLFAWLEENIPRKYKNPINLERGMEALSRADVFKGRIKATNWILLKYILDYLTVGVAYAKTEKEAGGFSPFVFPTLLKKLSSNKKEKIIFDNIVLKMQEKIHASKRIIKRDYIPFLLIIAQTNKFTKDIVNYFGFEHEEIKQLGAKISLKEYEKIIE
ncbi:MAG: replication factor C large subunit [Candidatus ainarchaeum sp.]|jgi:replication factor C large subunit|nr:replication factor C large subunit [Candidatus ainarchaeum sp.]